MQSTIPHAYLITCTYVHVAHFNIINACLSQFPGVMEPILEAIEALTVRAQQELEEGPDGTVLTTVQVL